MTAARMIRASNFTLQRTRGLALLALRPLSVAFATQTSDRPRSWMMKRLIEIVLRAAARGPVIE